MKWLFIALIAALAAFFLWPAQPGSQFHAVRVRISDQSGSIQKSAGLSAKSEEDKNELLTCKKAELKAYEDAIQQVDADIARMQSEVGTCPITGQPNQFILNQDPRPELRTKIDKIKEEIRQLENKS
jgi:parvulin-like peptidyl-prolyl isomerase